MSDLGTRLRAAREEQGISFAEAESATRIRERYLKALELNDWAALPSQVQARGFLRNYAIYLGLDEDEVISSFSQATRSAVVSLPVPAAKDSPVRTADDNGVVFRPRDIAIDRVATLPSWLSSDVFLGIALAVIVAALGFGLLRLASESSGDTSTPGGSAPGLTPLTNENLLDVNTTGASSASDATPQSATPTFGGAAGSVELSLEATEHVWVRVTVDGSQVLEGILAPETVQTWQAMQQIVLETPNGAGLQAVVNGQPQGPLGDRGQSVVLAWGPNGLVPLTPTAAP